MSAAELQQYFTTGSKHIEPDVLRELESIMRLHELSAEDMYYKWESYCIKMDMDSTSLSITTVRNFKQNLQDALEKSNRQASIKTEKRAGATPRAGNRGGSDVFGMLDGLVPNTPGTSKLNKTSSAKRKPYETPSMSRVRANVASSSPDFKSPLRMEEQLNSMGP